MRHVAGDHGVAGAGGDFVDDVAVVALEDRAGEPLVGGGGGVGGGVEVEEIGGCGVVGVSGGGGGGVLGAEESGVEPIGGGLEGVVGLRGLGIRVGLVGEERLVLLLLGLVREVVER